MSECTCPSPGLCPVFQRRMTPRLHHLCQTRQDYRGLFEKQKGLRNGTVIVEHVPMPNGVTQVSNVASSGPGSILHSLIRSVTGEEPTSLCGCTEMIAKLDAAGWKGILSPWKGQALRAELYEHLNKEADKRNMERLAKGEPIIEVKEASLFPLLVAAFKEWRRKKKSIEEQVAEALLEQDEDEEAGHPGG